MMKWLWLGSKAGRDLLAKRRDSYLTAGVVRYPNLAPALSTSRASRCCRMPQVQMPMSGMLPPKRLRACPAACAGRRDHSQKAWRRTKFGKYLFSPTNQQSLYLDIWHTPTYFMMPASVPPVIIHAEV